MTCHSHHVTVETLLARCTTSAVRPTWHDGYTPDDRVLTEGRNRAAGDEVRWLPEQRTVWRRATPRRQYDIT